MGLPEDGNDENGAARRFCWSLIIEQNNRQKDWENIDEIKGTFKQYEYLAHANTSSAKGTMSYLEEYSTYNDFGGRSVLISSGNAAYLNANKDFCCLDSSSFLFVLKEYCLAILDAISIKINLEEINDEYIAEGGTKSQEKSIDEFPDPFLELRKRDARVKELSSKVQNIYLSTSKIEDNIFLFDKVNSKDKAIYAAFLKSLCVPFAIQRIKRYIDALKEMINSETAFYRSENERLKRAEKEESEKAAQIEREEWRKKEEAIKEESERERTRKRESHGSFDLDTLPLRCLLGIQGWI